MDKLEKIKTESTNELERVEEAVPEAKEEKKFFSLFSFWKKIKTDGEEDFITENMSVKEKKGIMKYLNARTGVLAASLLIIAVAGYLNIRFSSAPAELR